MSQYDESLELGIAAGLNVPTAMVISERSDDQPPKEPRGRGCGQAVLVAVIAGAVVIAIACLLR